MAECIILKGGGGADLDVVTAGKPDVLTGKVIVDKDGEPLTGSMPNRGAISSTLNAGGSYTIPEGYHNGSGKVTANSLASQTSATASAGHILNGQTAWVNGNRITGNIASMGGQTITPNTSSHTLSCSGKYMTGNVYVPAVSNLSAGNIKKGVNVGGVTGTFEGYVPTATDLYLRGNNINGWHSTGGDTNLLRYDSQAITLLGPSRVNIDARKSFSTIGHSWLCFEMSITNGGTIELYAPDGATVLSRVAMSQTGNVTVKLNISSVSFASLIALRLYRFYGSLFRIYLS
ncbi:hypothetical protein [Lacrimispora amygdalina]|uniref:hypothetical protein n=1 Tax=Lacrimispora amygdalina TaxID=253257 RepID=UPI000BE327C5|nr:hypothetical protein [Lacrimispora amygdalina]